MIWKTVSLISGLSSVLAFYQLLDQSISIVWALLFGLTVFVFGFITFIAGQYTAQQGYREAQIVRSETIERDHDEIAKLRARVEFLEAELAETKDALNSLKLRSSAVIDDYQEMQEENKSLRDKLELCQDQRRELQVEVNTLKVKCGES